MESRRSLTPALRFFPGYESCVLWLEGEFFLGQPGGRLEESGRGTPGTEDLRMKQRNATVLAGWTLAPVIGLLLLCGCAQHYIMKLSNGYQIDSIGRPKLEHGNFRYRDALGHDHLIPESRVLEMEPSSMSAEEQKTFTPPQQHNPRHWYFLWLASAKEMRPVRLIAAGAGDRNRGCAAANG